MAELIITNALIVPMTEERRSFAGYVRVRNGAIAEIGGGAAPKIEDGKAVIDAAGCALMPGLINAHTHLYQVLLRAVWEDLELMPWLKRIYGCARVLRPEHFYAGSLLGCVEAIRSGVTTLCEHNFLNPSPECGLETIRAIRDSGLRSVFARTIMDTGEIVPDCTKEKPEQAFQRIDAMVARHGGDDLLTFMTGPNTPPINTTPELLREIAALPMTGRSASARTSPNRSRWSSACNTNMAKTAWSSFFSSSAFPPPSRSSPIRFMCRRMKSRY